MPHAQHNHQPALIGGIEAGGTKFVCAVGTPKGEIVDSVRFPTRDTDETLNRAVRFFREQPVCPSVIGIGSFGPVDLNPGSPTYGYITGTPKAGWANTDVVGFVERALGVPVTFETDVNAALVGEHTWGAAKGLENALYLTVGTGIGGGALVNGAPVHGLVHPEMGHLFLRRHPDDRFEGICPFHFDCLEGLATGPAIRARWGQPAETLPPDHPAWTLETHYLAHAITNLILVFSPERVILGGGVMGQKHLFPRIRGKVKDLLAGYVSAAQILEDVDDFIVPPMLGSHAGVLGAMAVALPLHTT